MLKWIIINTRKNTANIVVSAYRYWSSGNPPFILVEMSSITMAFDVEVNPYIECQWKIVSWNRCLVFDWIEDQSISSYCSRNPSGGTLMFHKTSGWKRLLKDYGLLYNYYRNKGFRWRMILGWETRTKVKRLPIAANYYSVAVNNLLWKTSPHFRHQPQISFCMHVNEGDCKYAFNIKNRKHGLFICNYKTHQRNVILS